MFNKNTYFINKYKMWSIPMNQNLIVGCSTSSSKYFMHIQDVTVMNIYTCKLTSVSNYHIKHINHLCDLQ